MRDILKFAKTAYLDSQTLKPLLYDYTNPDDLIHRMVKSGELIRLKNGFFVIAEKIKDQPIPYAQIANMLYGPSYISFEWALSFYQMILEGVYVVTSVTVNPSRVFNTPIGTFDYIYLRHCRYAIGISHEVNKDGGFLIASPEKALADLIHFKSNKLNPKDLLIDLVENRRIEEEVLKKMDKKLLMIIADAYHSKAVMNLIQVIGML